VFKFGILREIKEKQTVAGVGKQIKSHKSAQRIS
jgi:hypothetical protein